MMSNEILKKKILELAFSGNLINNTGEWDILDIDEAFISIPVKAYQINQTEIKSEGKYPVVSQSKELIEGYSNEESKLLNLYDNYVIFGDHNKIVKYINFPFIVGADGTKVFSSLNNNVKYLYYHMLYNSYFINSSGYTRNYKYLKELKYNLPCKAEQDKIVQKIDILFELIERKEQNDKELLKLKEVIKEKILSGYLECECDEVEISILLQKTNNVNWNDSNNDFRYIDLTSVDRETRTIRETSVINKSNAPSRAKQIVKHGDIIFGTTRPLLKRICFIPEEYDNQICSTGFCVLRPIPEKLDSKFLMYNLMNKKYYDYIEPLQRGVSYPAVSDKDVKGFKINLPTLEEQKKIVEKIESLFELIEQL